MKKGGQKTRRKRIPPLKRGDIVFIRHRKNFFRHFLRRFMDSYWDHTAMVLYPSQEERGRKYNVIAESIKKGISGYFATRGVAVHKLRKYLDNPKKYDVGIKRVPNLSEDQRVLVTHIMLMNVDSPYWPWKIFQVMLAAYIPWLKRIVKNRQRFSCSGVVQKAFYDALPWNKKETVVFKEGVWSPVELQELVTPGDIAKSSNCEWIYNER